MTKVFVDNDIILDVLLDRNDFKESIRLINHIEQKKISAYTSPLIFANTYYLVAKARDKQTAHKSLLQLRLLFKTTTINQDVIDLALASNLNDFEDAIQFFSALKLNCDYLITRNISDYPQDSTIRILTPTAYLLLNRP